MRLQRLPARHGRRRDEQGYSLVELVIAISLMGGVALMAASIFIAALRGDKQVHTTTQATMQSQTIAQGIERTVRNALRISVSGNTLNAWTTLSGDRTCQRWSLAGTGANATVQFAQASTTPGGSTDFTGSAAIKGAALTIIDVSTSGRVGVRYEVRLPSETETVLLRGTVRSRTLQDTTTVAGPATCGL